MERPEFNLLMKNLFLISCMVFAGLHSGLAQNPIITDQFTADPSARVFNDTVYLFPSHDIVAVEGRGRPGWFCMEDYHVFSSTSLTEWTDHGIIVSENQVPWADSTAYSMWAPDCIERDGKFYFYFPARSREGEKFRKARIGVAISEHPAGPYEILDEPMDGVLGIDPNPFIDVDGKPYLYWSLRNIYAAPLEENMTEIASEPVTIAELPDEGLKEGPWVFERNGIYYMTYPHVENEIERLEYAIGDNPLGPFTFAGVIMDESPMHCWTNHHSVIEYKGQWYLFYHQNALSPHFDKSRSVCIDSLFFNEDGTIQKVVPTHRGVGITAAGSHIQIDRYSEISDAGVSVEFMDTANTFEGWKVVFATPGSSVRYNAVGFEQPGTGSLRLKVNAPVGGSLKLRLNAPGNSMETEIPVPETKAWKVIECPVDSIPAGTYDLSIEHTSDNTIEIDWISFGTNNKSEQGISP